MNRLINLPLNIHNIFKIKIIKIHYKLVIIIKNIQIVMMIILDIMNLK
jgi:hypothetical protein